MKKIVQQKKHLHLLVFVALLALINASLLVFFNPRSIVFQKEIGDTEFGTPFPPVNAVAVANSPTQITLSWQPGPSGEFYTPTSFVIYRTVGSNFDFSATPPYDSVPLSQLFYSDTGLMPGTAYNYKVAARNGTVESGNSNIASVTTPLAVPAQPTGLTAVATNHNQVQLTWTSVPGATSYRIFRKQSEPVFSEQGSGPSNSFTDTSVVATTNYSYYVVAENTTGSGPVSEIVMVTTPSAPSSSTPVPPTTSNTDTTPPQISNVVSAPGIRDAVINWQTDEVSQGVLLYGATPQYGTDVTFSPNNSFRAPLTNILPATTYYYKIRATDLSGNVSEYTNTFTTLDEERLLLPPNNFQASTSSGRIVLSWQNPSGNTRLRGVKILRKAFSPSLTSSDGEVVVQGLQESAVDTAALFETPYFYTAFSFDDQNTISSGVVTTAQLNRTAASSAFPLLTPSSTTPAPNQVACNLEAIDCANPQCSTQTRCNKKNTPTATTSPDNLPLNKIFFFGARRQLTLLPQNNNIQSLPKRIVTISIPRSNLARTPQSIYLMRGATRVPLQYFSARNSYETEIEFLPTAQKEPVTLVVEYGRSVLSKTAFSLETLALGQVTLPGNLTSSSVRISLMSEDGRPVTVPESEFPNPTQNSTYGWMVPNGRYYVTVVYNGNTTSTPLFAVQNNIVNRPIIIQPSSVVSSLQHINSSEALTDIFIRDIVTPTSLFLAVLGLLAQVSLLDILALLRLVFLQPILLVGKRERKAWGQVYNSLNKLPVDLATVRLINVATGQIVQTRVTGRSGRFFFKVSPGSYRLEVVKSHLIFPSALLMKSKNDGKKTDLYHGENLQIKEHMPIIAVTIPVDPQVEEKNLARLRWERLGRLVQVVLSLFGSGVTVYSLILTPGKIHLWLLLAVHSVVLVLFIRLAIPRRPKGWGVVHDAASDRPLSMVVAKLYNTHYNRLVDYELTDRHGRYFFLAGDSTYQVRFEKAEYKVQLSTPIDVQGKDEEDIAINARLEREDPT